MRIIRKVVELIATVSLALAACGCRSSHPGFSPLPSKETRNYQSILEWSHQNGMPGAILLVRTPTTNFLGSVGWADVKRKTPMQPDHAFRIASITKMFVGITVAELARDGRLDPDLVITNYLSKSVTDHIRNSDRITVRHLVRHQSGIYNYTKSWRHEFLAWSLNPRGDWPALRHLKYAYDRPASFSPGEGWEYSNSNFILLGLIIDRVTGRHHSAEIRRRLIDPLQLTNTYYEVSELPGNERAHGYEKRYGRTLDTYDWAPVIGGNSGLVSTVSDLAVSVRAICGTNSFLDVSTRELLRSKVRPESHYAGSRDSRYPVLGYDFGINWRRTIHDKTPVSIAPVFFGHDGGIPGSLCFAWHDPIHDITIVWFGSSMFAFERRSTWQFQHELLERALFELALEQTRGAQ